MHTHPTNMNGIKAISLWLPIEQKTLYKNFLTWIEVTGLYSQLWNETGAKIENKNMDLF